MIEFASHQQSALLILTIIVACLCEKIKYSSDNCLILFKKTRILRRIRIGVFKLAI